MGNKLPVNGRAFDLDKLGVLAESLKLTIERYNEKIHCKMEANWLDAVWKKYEDLSYDTIERMRYNSDDNSPIELDRHKVAACLAAAVLLVKPIKCHDGMPPGKKAEPQVLQARLCNQWLAYKLAEQHIKSNLMSEYDLDELAGTWCGLSRPTTTSGEDYCHTVLLTMKRGIVPVQGDPGYTSDFIVWMSHIMYFLEVCTKVTYNIGGEWRTSDL
ncbi:MAG: hypothetical protein H7831_05475 [Magnetococcus sp. WYHC-3]